MLKKSLLFCLIILFCIVCSCPKYEQAKHYNSFVVNLTEINTEYDDFNMASPAQSIDIPSGFEVVFSTNRGSNGEDYDVWRAKIYISENGENFNISSEVIGEYAPNCNSDYNEFGPYILNKNIAGTQLLNGTIPDNNFYYLFASDRTGDKGGLDIYFTDDNLTEPKPVFFNSSYDDAYPTFFPIKSIWYFCSNRGGVFNIYSIKTNYHGDSMGYWFSNGIDQPQVFIDSTADDKCPYVGSNMMVYVSDKSGGYGGFDIYYLLLESDYFYPHHDDYNEYYTDSNNDDFESEIKNIGGDINSKYNEYRPTIYRVFGDDYGGDVYSGNFLIFSSDRPGGKGGYDLYLAYFEITSTTY